MDVEGFGLLLPPALMKAAEKDDLLLAGLPRNLCGGRKRVRL